MSGHGRRNLAGLHGQVLTCEENSTGAHCAGPTALKHLPEPSPIEHSAYTQQPTSSQLALP
eukprot:scaffold47993_cov56-Phaeocystis_antarctica.AAC.2